VTSALIEPLVSGETIHTILLATDLSPASDLATERAVELAARLRARLVVVNVLERRRLSGRGAHDRVDQARAEREAALVDVVERARAAGAHAEFIVWGADPPSAAPAVSALAQAEHAVLIVVGTRGRDRAGRFLLGSVSDEIVRTADCPVLVVRPTANRAVPVL
jgi:nucleotide-binding universal stress UspA family protein